MRSECSTTTRSVLALKFSVWVCVCVCAYMYIAFSVMRISPLPLSLVCALVSGSMKPQEQTGLELCDGFQIHLKDLSIELSDFSRSVSMWFQM